MLFSRTPSITPAEALERQRTGDLVLVDVREPAELAEARIAGARHIPLGELGAQLPGLDPDTPVAFVCQSGMRSARAAKAAAKAGLDAVNVTGGLAAWARADLPLTR